ncbi:MAG: hypothetical protein ACRDA8_07815 [Shewanella sp.]
MKNQVQIWARGKEQEAKDKEQRAKGKQESHIACPSDLPNNNPQHAGDCYWEER